MVQTIPAGGTVLQPLFHLTIETHMSADKDRGIRREKQKRAKEAKKQARQPARAAAGKAPAKAAAKPAA
jgi:hypothetical protein